MPPARKSAAQCLYQHPAAFLTAVAPDHHFPAMGPQCHHSRLSRHESGPVTMKLKPLYRSALADFDLYAVTCYRHLLEIPGTPQ